ncbi:MAG: hypothetical protein AB1641_14655 [Thermodesulfobacteriota bacterium]
MTRRPRPGAFKKGPAFLLFLAALCFYGCGGPPDPLIEIGRTLSAVPTFSVILDDMKEEGLLFKDYFHKYKVIAPEKTTQTDWKPVSSNYYSRHLPFLGMTIYHKKDGKVEGAYGPPGYEYVGDTRYGHWQTNTSGQSFWTFYGQYRLFSDLLGGGPIYRDHYNSYSSYRSQGRPYYGPNNEYGTSGSMTQKQRPDFFTRRMSKETAKKSSFASKVEQRTGRTSASTSVRSRSGGSGK